MTGVFPIPHRVHTGGPSARRRLLSFPLASALLALVVVPDVLAAQDRPARERPGEPEARMIELPAHARVPDDIQEMERLERQAGRDPQTRITAEYVLRALEELGGGPERAGERAEPMAASPEMPPELRELDAMDRAARRSAPRRPPSPREVMDAIRGMPDGREVLEKARRRGAPVSAGPGRLRTLLAASSPFRVREAWARSSSFAVHLTPSHPRVDSPAAGLRLTGVRISSCCSNHWAYLYADHGVNLTGLSVFHRHNKTEHSVAQFYVTVPTTGWYTINVRGYSWGSRAELRRPGRDNFALVASWDYRSASPAWQNYPTIVYLARGRHNFYPRDGTIALSVVSIHSR